MTESDLKAAPFLNISGLSQDIGRTLIVAPHPDDEVLGCGGLIALLRKQQSEVHVAFVTSGGASHPNSIIYPPEKLKKLRQKEAIQSCTILGVVKENIHFIGLEDSKLDGQNESQQVQFNNKINRLFGLCSFDSLVTTWRKDAHNDHRATYQFCKKFLDELNRPIQCIEYPIWLWKNGKIEDWPSYNEVEPYRLDVSTVKDKKIEAIKAHKSQTSRLINDDPDGFMLTEDLLKPFMADEYFLFTQKVNKPTLNSKYFERLYENSKDPWNFRTSAYEQDKYQKTAEYLRNYHFENALEIGCSIGEHSNVLSKFCKRLTAIDISPKAIQTAKKTYSNQPIDFKVWDIAEGLPNGKYDLITICEVGYYLNKKDLSDLYENMHHHLNVNGVILMVHWTSYVRDYPLSGRQVHAIFKNSDLCKLKYESVNTLTEKLYELMLWQKLED